MTAKEYLSQIRTLDQRIQQNRCEYKRIKSDMYTLRPPDISKEMVSDGNSRRDADYVKLVERADELYSEIARDTECLLKLRHRIIREIQALDNSNHRDLLFKRYVEFKEFSVIAKEMCYGFQYIRNMHGVALKKFEDIYKL